VPRTEVIYYREPDARTPLLEWLDGLAPRARERSLACLAQLETLGYELRRPQADYLGDGIYELRVKHSGVNYRMLYFFHEGSAVVMFGFVKQHAQVSPGLLRRAARLKRSFEDDPKSHSFRGRP
jgi:phage-related protein